MNFVAIIPARIGSKGIKKKNIKSFCGRPLISYIIKTATKVKEIDRVIVSTENSEIAKISKSYGAEIPFTRPKELSKDNIPTIPVLKHAINYLENKEKYNPDIIILLYATSPLLKYSTLTKAISYFKKGKFDSLISVTLEKGNYWIKKKNFRKLYPKERKNRQQIKPLYKENGCIYIVKKDLIKEDKIVGGKIGFFVMEKKESIDINDPLDFKIAEFILKKVSIKNEIL